MGQLIRIREMEQMLNDATAALSQMHKALERYEAAQHSIALLAAYMGSDEWRQDLSDDERGLLPPDIKRGELSEDGIWNLLEDNHETALSMQALANRLLNED